MSHVLIASSFHIHTPAIGSSRFKLLRQHKIGIGSDACHSVNSQKLAQGQAALVEIEQWQTLIEIIHEDMMTLNSLCQCSICKMCASVLFRKKH